MSDKITLDIDFDDELEPTEDIPIISKQTNTTQEDRTQEDKTKEELVQLINSGLKICEENNEHLEKVLENIHLFLNTGVNDNMIFVLNYLSEMFRDILPCLFTGKYEDIVLQSSNLDFETDIELLKYKRKELLKKIQDENNNKNK